MGKKIVQFAALLLVVCLIPLVPAQAVEEDPIIRVGLYYGSSTLPGANLLNSVGEGYRFGQMDGDAFVSLGSTTETAISVVKTQNVWYTDSLPGGGYGYSDEVTSNIAVGCYHLVLPGTYATFEEASSAASLVAGGFPAWISGSYQARVGTYLSAADAEAAKAALGLESASVAGTSAYGLTVVATGTAQPLFQYDGGTSDPCLVIKPGQDDSIKTITHFKGLKYYGSFRYERINGGDLTVVNLVPLEDYIRGILPYEMSNSWPLEALKAQAVCARSYTMTNLNRHSSYHFDICNTTHCQVYYGTGSANDNTDRAVEETIGEYAWYNGKIAITYYHSCDGGATENVENVWSEPLPYLRGVSDPYEALIESRISNYHWTKTYTRAELKQRLNSLGYQCGEIADLYVSQTTDMGNVYSVVVTDVNGKTWTISKDNARTVLGANSLRYTISGGSGGGGSASNSYTVTDGTLDSLNEVWVIDGDGTLTQIGNGTAYAITGDGVQTVSGTNSSSGSGLGTGTNQNTNGSFVLTGTGHGHNLGMSQWGAYAMAQQGYTYRDILTFYFTGIEIHE